MLKIIALPISLLQISMKVISMSHKIPKILSATNLCEIWDDGYESSANDPQEPNF